MVKNLPANAEDARDMGLIRGLGRVPAEGNGNSLQYSCLENSTDRERATVHGVPKSRTRLSTINISLTIKEGIFNSQRQKFRSMKNIALSLSHFLTF